MTVNIGAGRLVRICDVCGGYDDHPRHVVAGNEGTAPPDQAVIAKIIDADDIASEDKPALLADLYDTTLMLRHLDCCRTVGCPDGTCNTQTAGAENKRGAALLKHLMSLAEEV